jgi:hypothetical protein
MGATSMLGIYSAILAGLILRAWRHKQEKPEGFAPEWRAKVSARWHRTAVTAG